MNLYFDFPNRHLTENLILPGNEKGLEIEWKSSNPAFLSDDGIVKRPEAGQKDEKVILTAKIKGKRQRGQPSQLKYSFLVLARPLVQPLEDFSLDEVKLLDDYYLKVEKKVVDFLNSFNIDKLLYNFRLNAGYSPDEIPGKSSYSGWENTRIGGHTLGHYLSAAAQAVKKGYGKLTGKDGISFEERLLCIIDELYKCQQHNDELSLSNPNRKKGFLFGAVMDDKAFPEIQFDRVESENPSDTWVPWYTMHKILQGLIYVYKYTDNQKALKIALNLSEWVYERVIKWNQTIKNRVLKIEYGGMNDCLYEIYRYAKLCGYENKEHIKIAAGQFDEDSLFEKIFCSSKDSLNNLHANTTIPKYLGILNRYRLFKDDKESLKYLDYVKNFWKLVVEKHTYITGGNSECEHFGKDNLLDGKRSNCNCETCNSHNFLKITRELFKITGEKKYADFYENAFINSILASVNEENGMTTYFQPMATGCFKVFCNPDIDKNYFWCCTGTGFENFTKLGDSFFYKKNKMIFINEYVSSKIYWKEENLTVHVDADLEKSEKVQIKIQSSSNKENDFSVFLRIPQWASNDNKISVCINNKKTSFLQSNGYIQLSRKWKNDDCVELILKKSVREYSLPDNEGDVLAFKYGPYVLAADLGVPEKRIIRQIGVMCDVCGEKNVWGQSLLLKGNYGGTGNVEILSNENILLPSRTNNHEIVKRIHLKKNAGKPLFELKVKNDRGDNLRLKLHPYYRMNKNRYGIYWYFRSEKINNNSDNHKVEIDGIGVGYGAQTEGDKNVYPCLLNEGTGSVADSGALTRYARANGSFSYYFEISEKYDTYLSCLVMKNDDADGLRIESDGVVIGEISSKDDETSEQTEYIFKIPQELIKEAERIDGKKVIRISFSGINKHQSLKLCAPAGTFYYEE